MHELALAEEIVAAAVRAADAHGGGRIERVHLVVRDPGHVTVEILDEAFRMAATGTRAESAELSIEVPPRLCADCARDRAGGDDAIAVTAIDVADEAAEHVTAQSG